MIKLKKNHDRRVRKGHLWVFSNEIEDPPVSELEPGSVRDIADSSGEFIGRAYVNPQSLITARILTHRKEPIDRDFLYGRLERALEYRSKIYGNRTAYRLVFAESDGLPGLVVDRYGAHLSMQSTTAGMDALLPDVVEVLIDMLEPEGIFLRNDVPIRELEGLDQEKRLLHGTVPDTIEIDCHGVRTIVDVINGQKTGWFFDQQENRRLAVKYSFPGADVLDLYSYSAGWGLQAAKAGADNVTAVDSSRGALKLADATTELNGLGDIVHTVRDNILEFLKKAHKSRDLVILDPPALIPSRSKVREGRKGYIDINKRALSVVRPGGFMITCSCSHHLEYDAFTDIVRIAAQGTGRTVRIVDSRPQAPDHPILVSMPETAYLKVLVAHVW